MSKIIAMVIRAIAEGEKSNPATKVYWKLVGKKTYIALGIYAIYLILTGVVVPFFSACGANCGATPEGIAEFNRYAQYLVDLSLLLGGVGLFDAAVRLEPPKKKD